MEEQHLVFDGAAYASLYPANVAFDFINRIQLPIDNMNGDLEIGVVEVVLNDEQVRRIANHAMSCSLIEPYQVGDKTSQLLKITFLFRREPNKLLIEDFVKFYDPVQYYPLARGIHSQVRFTLQPLFLRPDEGSSPVLPNKPPASAKRMIIAVHIRKRKD